METLSKNSQNSCSVIIKNNSMHMSTLPTGTKRYFEIPINTVKPY